MTGSVSSILRVKPLRERVWRLESREHVPGEGGDSLDFAIEMDYQV
jgi:hypothetical protein